MIAQWRVRALAATVVLGVAAFVADSALGPPMLATAIAGWLVMPDALTHR